MAAGDILSVAVGADGWWADITIEGKSTGGTYNFGLGADNDPATGTPRVVFTVVSMGYDSAGAATTVSRTVWGVQQLRKAYPDQAQNEETAGGGNVTVRIALSDYIYQKDNSGGGNSGTAPTVSILASFYTQSGGNNASGAGFAVTNNSTVAYPKVIGHFAVEQRRSLNASADVEVFCVHKYGRNGNPVARVTVTATGGTSSNVESGSATAMTLSARGDSIPVYAVNLPFTTAAGFTRGELVTVNFTAYPWIGDSGAVLDSTTDAGTQIFQLQTLKWTIMDKMIARVDGVGAGTPTASTNQATADANPFASIAAAMAGIAAANNTAYSLNRLDGGEVQCNAGTYSWNGSASGTSSNGYFTITHHSSTNRAGVVFDNFTSSRNQKAYQRFYNVTFTRGSNIIIFFAANTNVMVMESVNFADTATAFYSGDTNTNIEYLDCVSNNGNFVRGGNDGHSRLVRNYTYTATTEGPNGAIGNASCVLGLHSTGGTKGMWSYLASSGTNNYLFGYCEMMSLSDGLTWNNLATGLTNIAIVNNVIERISAAATPLAEISDGNISNLLLAHNTFAGQRFNHENDISAPYVNKTFTDYVGKLNTFNARGDHRADIFDSTAGMTGTWSVGYSVGWSNNHNEAITYAGDTDFWGIKSNTDTGTSISPSVDAGFTDDRSRSGTDTGGGNYLPDVGSILRNRVTTVEIILPFDIDGNTRGDGDSVGAFTTYVPSGGGIGAASHRNNIDLSLVSAVNGITKAGIASLNGQ